MTLSKVREALTLARQWVEANTAQVRGMSPAAAEPGEAALRQIDEALALLSDPVMDGDADIGPMSSTHLREMLAKIEASPTSFSQWKLGKWVGWMQCVVVARGRASLEDMKALNKRLAPAPSPDTKAEDAANVLSALVAALDEVHASPEYQSVWTVSQLHIGPYKGPTYTAALAAARNFLSGNPPAPQGAEAKPVAADPHFPAGAIFNGRVNIHLAQEQCPNGQWDEVVRCFEAMAQYLEALPAPTDPAAIRREKSQAASDVLAERERQRRVEGWTDAHDDQHSEGEMADAAASYAGQWLPDQMVYDDGGEPKYPIMWPWNSEWWKPKGRRRDLVRAGALIVAEIERLDRAALRALIKDVERDDRRRALPDQEDGL